MMMKTKDHDEDEDDEAEQEPDEEYRPPNRIGLGAVNNACN